MKRLPGMLLAFVCILLCFSAAQSARAQFDFVTIGHTNNSPTSMSAWAYGVVVSGNYVYVANHADGLRTYDVSDPANPRNVGHISAGGYADGIVVVGDHAYLSGNGLGLKVFNISNPANPINVGHTNISADTFEGIAAAGNYVYLAFNYLGLYVCDISNPTNPIVVAHTNNNLPYTYGLAVADNRAYLAGMYNQSTNSAHLRTYDVSNPPQTVAIASSQTNNSAISRIAVAGTNAYLLEGTYGFHVYNISNPGNPIDLAHVDPFAAFGHGLTVAGNFAYVANDHGINGLLMYDVSNPSKPVRVGTFNNPGSAYDAALSGNYLYLANGYDGLRIVGIVPQLRLSRINNNRVVLSWPIPPAPDYALQQNSDLSTTNWLAVTNSRSVVSNRYQVVIPASENNSFYRLKYP